MLILGCVQSDIFTDGESQQEGMEMKGEYIQPTLFCTWATPVPVQSRVHYA